MQIERVQRHTHICLSTRFRNYSWIIFLSSGLFRHLCYLLILFFTGFEDGFPVENRELPLDRPPMCSSTGELVVVHRNRYRVGSIWASLNGLFISLMNIFNEIFSLTKCRLLCRISIYFVVRTSAIAALSIALYIALLTLLVDHWLVCVDVRRNLCESLWFITIDMHDSWPARFINKNRCHSMVELISSGEKPARRVVCVL